MDKENKKTQAVQTIVAYLNKKTGKDFKPGTSSTIKLIQARQQEGFTESDFFKVIDIKTAEWLHDRKMQPYLRPETLFGNKFEGYLNSYSKVAEHEFKMRNAC